MSRRQANQSSKQAPRGRCVRGLGGLPAADSHGLLPRPPERTRCCTVGYIPSPPFGGWAARMGEARLRAARQRLDHRLGRARGRAHHRDCPRRRDDRSLSGSGRFVAAGGSLAGMGRQAGGRWWPSPRRRTAEHTRPGSHGKLGARRILPEAGEPPGGSEQGGARTRTELRLPTARLSPAAMAHGARSLAPNSTRGPGFPSVVLVLVLVLDVRLSSLPTGGASSTRGGWGERSTTRGQGPGVALRLDLRGCAAYNR